ncbi:MarR family winged helix-turn-helix transcriptional regulator [Sphaerisporangium sp. NPDC051017]|uniref:MarR family winged helix-turn-helix transcriptional regulator n=1 Tax=Sphaerisporangium sp. NPDC051017 TaxID=3154636 RepID=UPI003434AE72
MASEEGCGELLARLSDMGAVIKAIKRDLPFTGPHAGLALLATLHRCGEQRIGDLAGLFEVDLSVMSRHVADLRDRGWIERVPNPHDGRSWYVRLTPDGTRVAEDNLARVRRLLAETLEDWTDDEVAELSVLIGRLRSSFDAHRARATRLPRTAQTRTAQTRTAQTVPQAAVPQMVPQTVKGH